MGFHYHQAKGLKVSSIADILVLVGYLMNGKVTYSGIYVFQYIFLNVL